MSRTQRPVTTSKRRRLTAKELEAMNCERNTWTPRMAAEWAGIPLRTLYRLLGHVPSRVSRWAIVKPNDGPMRAMASVDVRASST